MSALAYIAAVPVFIRHIWRNPRAKRRDLLQVHGARATGCLQL